MITFQNSLSELFSKQNLTVLESKLLPNYLKTCRWFGGKARPIKHVEILEMIDMRLAENVAAYWFILQVFYEDAYSELYQLPFSLTTTDVADLKANYAKAIIGEFEINGEQGVFYDAVYSEAFRNQLFQYITANKHLGASNGQMVFEAGKALLQQYQPETPVHSKVLAVEQSNTSIIYNNKYFLKLFRKLDRAINPDLEINRFFAAHTQYTNVPTFAGAVELQEPNVEPIMVAMMQEMIENQGDAWKLTLQFVKEFLQKVIKLPKKSAPPVVPNFYRLDFKSVHKDLQDLITPEVYHQITLLAKRTAEMHLALASTTEVPAFAPKPFSMDYQQSLHQYLSNALQEKLAFLEDISPKLPKAVKEDVEKVLKQKSKIADTLAPLKKQTIHGLRTRIHGDFHLGQVLFTGNDFVIIDFEGEPATPFAERRLKYSPLKDVAGMVRSFHYAAYATLLQDDEFRYEHNYLSAWAEAWYLCVRSFYIDTYLDTVAHTDLAPKQMEQLEILLKAYLLEKAVYELCYEVNNRPDWVLIPLNGILKLLA
jgi:maltose alpha-D-glucosyltransferase/alpha-amylase